MKYILYILPAVMFFCACDLKEDHDTDRPVDERLKEQIDEYTEVLAGSPNGWLLAVDTEVNGVYRHWVTFDKENRTTMLSDLDASWIQGNNWGISTSKDIQESSYRLRAVQRISLIFDTYNYLHWLSDPQGNDNAYRPGNGGTNGSGLISDFDFSIMGMDEGKVKLQGRYNKVGAELVPATPDEVAAITQGALKEVHEIFEDFVNTNYANLNIEVDGKSVWIKPGTRRSAVQTDTDEFSAPSYLDFAPFTEGAATSNLIMFEPLYINDKQYIDRITWDGTDFNAHINGRTYRMYDTDVPSIKFSFGPLGFYKGMHIDETELTGTMVDPFLTDVWLRSKNNLLSAGSRIWNYVDLSFTVNSAGVPVMALELNYSNTAGSSFNAAWYYKYTFNEDMTEITFYDRDQAGSSNENGREAYVPWILNYFCDVQYSASSGTYINWIKSSVTPRTFAIDWIKNTTPGSNDAIGGFIPLDDTASYCPGRLTR